MTSRQTFGDGAGAGQVRATGGPGTGERAWAARLPPAAVDVLPAVVVLAAMAAVRLGSAPEPGSPLPTALALAAVIAGSLAVRRRSTTGRAVVCAGSASGPPPSADTWSTARPTAADSP
ncbi:hypothetical protein [Streptomyces sp. NPDC050263]|uniref:hypothetical protein n=1 Tax=Streptomyces sp. NPDC050263 TaxID=3155037 RepID=UPI0034287A94